jgi:hypothetical protein
MTTIPSIARHAAVGLALLCAGAPVLHAQEVRIETGALRSIQADAGGEAAAAAGDEGTDPESGAGHAIPGSPSAGVEYRLGPRVSWREENDQYRFPEAFDTRIGVRETTAGIDVSF